MHNLPGGRLLQSNCLLSALNEQGRISVHNLEDEAMYNNIIGSEMFLYCNYYVHAHLEIDGHQNWLRVKSSNKEFEWKKSK